MPFVEKLRELNHITVEEQLDFNILYYQKWQGNWKLF